MVEKDRKIKVIYKDQTVKIYNSKDLIEMKNQRAFMDRVDTMWLLNPVSGFWQSLRFFKDIFSTLNQRTAVYVFDCYLKEARKYFKVQYQVHDEFLTVIKKNKYTQEQIIKILKKCINRVNDKLKLPIPMDISADFGVNYAQCH